GGVQGGQFQMLLVAETLSRFIPDANSCMNTNSPGTACCLPEKLLKNSSKVLIRLCCAAEGGVCYTAPRIRRRSGSRKNPWPSRSSLMSSSRSCGGTQTKRG